MTMRSHIRRKGCALTAASVLFICSLVQPGMVFADSEETVNEQTETENEAGARTVTCTVVSLVGNQLTYQVTEDSSKTEASEEIAVEDGTEAAGLNNEGSESGGRPQMSERSEGSSDGENGDRPQMPERSESSSDDENGDRPQMPERSESSSDDERGDMPQMSMDENGRSGHAFSDMMEASEETAYIPVSAPVTTANGTSVAYSIIEAGDTLEISFETDENGNELITGIVITEMTETASSSESSMNSGMGGGMQGGMQGFGGGGGMPGGGPGGN